jgi:hypothetical protein
MIEDIKAWLKKPSQQLETRLDPGTRPEEADQQQRRAAAERQALLARARAEFDAGAGERALRLIYDNEICDEIVADHNRSLILSRIMAEISTEYVRVRSAYQSQAERHEQNSTASLALEAAVFAGSMAVEEMTGNPLPLDRLWPWTNREFASRGLREDLLSAGALTLLAIENLDSSQ